MSTGAPSPRPTTSSGGTVDDTASIRTAVPKWISSRARERTFHHLDLFAHPPHGR
jgi:hypothetical protein